MPTPEEEILIRNGTPSDWLSYTVVFFGKKEPGYAKIEGGLRVKSQWLVLGLMLAAFGAGLAI